MYILGDICSLSAAKGNERGWEYIDFDYRKKEKGGRVLKSILYPLKLGFFSSSVLKSSRYYTIVSF